MAVVGHKGDDVIRVCRHQASAVTARPHGPWADAPPVDVGSGNWPTQSAQGIAHRYFVFNVDGGTRIAGLGDEAAYIHDDPTTIEVRRETSPGPCTTLEPGRLRTAR